MRNKYRKAMAWILVVALCFGLCGCGSKDETKGDTEGSADSVSKNAVIEEDLRAKELATSVTDCMEYSLETYMLPYWESEVIYNESVMPLENFDGEMKPISLMYDIAAVVSVKSSSLEIVYEEGKDYVIEDGQLKIIKEGAIPTIEYDFMYPAEDSAIVQESSVMNDKTHGYMYFAEGSAFHDMQLAVTYIPKGTWEGSLPESKTHLLPKTMEKLTNAQDLKIVVYGDSISVGANSTKFVNAAPYCENYFEMVIHSLENKYGSNITFDNPSVGGTDSNWGAENAKELVADKNPDLVIVAFGMNDGSIGVPNTAFKINIRMIMNAVSESNPDCEFILVAPMIQNKDWPNAGKQALFLLPLSEMEEEGCAVADVTSLHEYLLTRKRYVDMTGNHVNHPNDFLVRLYAQVIFEIFR